MNLKIFGAAILNIYWKKLTHIYVETIHDMKIHEIDDSDDRKKLFNFQHNFVDDATENN